MKWKGETDRQRYQRVSNWHRHFCLVPTQMHDGKWVWLEVVWAKLRLNLHPPYWEYRDCVAEPEEVIRSRPPTPVKK